MQEPRPGPALESRLQKRSGPRLAAGVWNNGKRQFWPWDLPGPLSRPPIDRAGGRDLLFIEGNITLQLRKEYAKHAGLVTSTEYEVRSMIGGAV